MRLSLFVHVAVRTAVPDQRAWHMDLFDLAGRVAVVTGASRGLGVGLAEALARAGATVVCTARSADALDAVCARLVADGGDAHALPADVGRAGDVEALRDRVLEEHGRIDVLVNNAGVNVVKPALEISDDEWAHVLEVNLAGYFRTARAFGAAMLQQAAGSIVNVSSVYGTVAMTRQAPYAASKGGVEQLTKVLALEWADQGVRVNALAPGFVEVERTMALYEGTPTYDAITERIPMRRWARPGDFGGPVVYLASPASAYMTGQTLLVDGGLTAW